VINQYEGYCGNGTKLKAFQSELAKIQLMSFQALEKYHNIQVGGYYMSDIFVAHLWRCPWLLRVQ